MRDYELKRGHWKNIDGEKLVHLIQDVFQVDPKKEGNGYVVEDFGALQRLYVEQLGRTHVRIDSTMNPKVDTEESQRTMRAWNDFLELATGLNSKERAKRAKKEAEKDAAKDAPKA